MLEDRDYMRQSSGHLRWSATVVLIIINIAIFFLQRPLFQAVNPGYLVLSLEGLKHGYLWQLLTFQFLHAANPLHVVFNCLAIYFFGRPVEMALGRSRWLAIYFGSGIAGGLMQMLFAIV